MNGFEEKIQSVLVKSVPLPSDAACDWEDVVRRAGAPEKAVDAVRARRSTRSYLARRLVPVVALAATAFVFVMIAPWQHGRSFTSSAVAERALVALGDGPVLHVVMNVEEYPASYVDLASGEKRPVYFGTEEIWYDSERHFTHLKVDDESNPADQIWEELQTPNGTWSLDYARTEDAPPLLDPALGGFLDGYRSALENGDAKVTGAGTVDGRDVTWIEFDTKQRDLPYVERVAVDNASSLPIRLETASTIDTDPVRKLHRNYEILSIETTPAGSGDFSKPEKNPFPSYRLGRDQVTSIAPGDAAQALPGALWTGRSISGLQLSSVFRAELVWRNLSDPESTRPIGTGIELRYGDGSPGQGVLWADASNGTGVVGVGAHGSYIVLQEAQANLSSFKAPPAGSIGVLDSEPVIGWLVKDGTNVLITASSRDLLLATARALTPIQQ
jgi:hypothetical protein